MDHGGAFLMSGLRGRAQSPPTGRSGLANCNSTATPISTRCSHPLPPGPNNSTRTPGWWAADGEAICSTRWHPSTQALAGRCSRRSSGDAQRRQLSQPVAQHTSHVPGGTRHGHRRSRRWPHRARRGNLIAGGRTGRGRSYPGRGRSYPRRTRLCRTTCGLDRSPRGKLHPRHRDPAEFRNPRCPSPQSRVSRRR